LSHKSFSSTRCARRFPVKAAPPSRGKQTLFGSGGGSNAGLSARRKKQVAQIEAAWVKREAAEPVITLLLGDPTSPEGDYHRHPPPLRGRFVAATPTFRKSAHCGAALFRIAGAASVRWSVAFLNFHPDSHACQICGEGGLKNIRSGYGLTNAPIS
jgi:hypothetical protein